MFGYALPSESVAVNMTIAGVLTQYHTVADGDGKWRVVVAPSGTDLTPSGVGFTVAAASDVSPVTINNATFGEVFLCNASLLTQLQKCHP